MWLISPLKNENKRLVFSLLWILLRNLKTYILVKYWKKYVCFKKILDFILLRSVEMPSHSVLLTYRTVCEPLLRLAGMYCCTPGSNWAETVPKSWRVTDIEFWTGSDITGSDIVMACLPSTIDFRGVSGVKADVLAWMDGLDEVDGLFS